ncbi:unnamed protein product, partial [Heterosigma akashiwo]
VGHGAAGRGGAGPGGLPRGRPRPEPRVRPVQCVREFDRTWRDATDVFIRIK